MHLLPSNTKWEVFLQYILSPTCKTPSNQALALSATDDGKVTVELASNVVPNIIWSCVYSFALGGFPSAKS